MALVEHCSNFPIIAWDSGSREKTSFIMPEALGKPGLDLGWEEVCGPSASPSLRPQAPIAPRPRLLSAPPRSPVPNSRLTSPGQTLQAAWKRERMRSHPCVHCFLTTFPPKRGKKGDKLEIRRSKLVFPPSRLPLSPRLPAVSLKSQSLFAQNPEK